MYRVMALRGVMISGAEQDCGRWLKDPGCGGQRTGHPAVYSSFSFFFRLFPLRVAGVDRLSPSIPTVFIFL